MDINKEIRNYLTKRRESAINAVSKVNNPHPLLMEIFSELREIDEKAVQNTFTDELKKTVKSIGQLQRKDLRRKRRFTF